MDRRPPPVTSCAPLCLSRLEVEQAIRSFSPGSAGGLDGFRPQHLVDILDSSSSGSFSDTLTAWSNLVLAGGVPLLVRQVFFGASLFAINKKDGGVRPIAVGLTLRRLVAKASNRWAISKCLDILMPHQLGVGAKGGAEAIIHASKAFLGCIFDSQAPIKLDFCKCF